MMPDLIHFEQTHQKEPCHFCGKHHVCSSEAAERAATEQCRQQYFGFMLRREFIREVPAGEAAK